MVDLYSPELLAAQEELLQASKAAKTSASREAPYCSRPRPPSLEPSAKNSACGG